MYLAAVREAATSGTAGREEIELKLALPEEQLARIARHPLLRSLAARRAVNRTLRTVYFDTPDLALARRGMALRVRHIDGRRTQTLKIARIADRTLQRQQEFEHPLAGDRPDLALIEDEPLQAVFAEQEVAARLRPLFETRIERRVLPLRMAESEIELALDRGEIRSGRRRMPLCEAELELRSGRPGRLFELALALNGELPFTLEHRTKAARGYALFAGERPAPERAMPVALGPEATAREAFVAIARNCLAQIRGNEPCVAQDTDPEGVHQMRVGLRRMRALVALYRGLLAPQVHGFLAGELRWLQRQLGPARDWDVFLHETAEPLRRRLADEPAVEALRRMAERQRAAARETAREALRSPRYTALLLRLGLWLEAGGWENPEEAGALDEPAAAFAAAALQRRHKRMRKLGGKHGEASEAELHQLRLQAKKQRYGCEFFRAVFPRKPARRYIAALVRIQEALGTLNDAAVGRRLLAVLDRRTGAGEANLLETGAAIVLGWQAARIELHMAAFPAVWDEFRSRDAFWSRR